MAEKIIKTKIALRWLEYATWSTEAFKAEKPLKGEVWFCEVPAGNANAQTAPTMLFKVGDGVNTFGTLKWASALAADVYDWAKKNEVKFVGEGNAVTDAYIKDGYLEFNKGTKFATKAELDAAIEAFGGDLSAITDNDHQYTFTYNEDTGTLKVTATNYVNGKAGETTTVLEADFVSGKELETVLAGYYTKGEVDGLIQGVRDDIPTELGVMSIAKGDDTITIGGTAKNPTIAVTANKFDAYGAAAQALVDAKAYADAKPHENTAHTHSVGDGLKKTGDGGIDGDVKHELNLAFVEDKTNKLLKLVDADDNTKVIADFDTTNFIADGMLASVTPDATNNKLVFEWNTTAGITKTEIEFDKIADIYTGSNGADINVTVSNTNVISASLSTGAWSAINAKANTADLKALAKKDKVTENDIEGTIAVGKISGLGALATKDNITHDLVTDFDTAVAAIKVANATDADHADNADTADYATEAGDAEKLGGQLPGYYATKSSVDAIPGTIDSKIAAYNTSKNFGDIITHNAAEFATSAQGGKADTALQEVTTTANGGLKVTNKNQIDIDTDVVFVLDCN